MNRLASREPAAAAVATWPMPSSSANEHGRVHQRPADAVAAELREARGARPPARSARGSAGSSCVTRRCTAPATSPSYSATTTRSSAPPAARSMTVEQVRDLLLAVAAAQHLGPQLGQQGRVGRHRAAQRHQGAAHRSSAFQAVRAVVAARSGPPSAAPARDYAHASRLSEESRVPRNRHPRQRRHGPARSAPLGVLLGNRLPVRTRDVVTDALGLVTLLIAGTSAMAVLDPDLSDAVGLERADADRARLAAARRHRRLAAPPRAARGGVRRLAAGAGWPARPGRSSGTASSRGSWSPRCVFCTGPLTILGSLNDGLGNGADQLFLKSVLDGFAAIAFAASFGWGVAASALTVVVGPGQPDRRRGPARRRAPRRRTSPRSPRPAACCWSAWPCGCCGSGRSRSPTCSPRCSSPRCSVAARRPWIH